MGLDVDIGDGADALTINQLQQALSSTYHVSGCALSLGPNALEVDVASGTVVVDDAEVSFGGATADLSGDVDPDDPRKVVLSINSNGSLVTTAGTPAPPAPSGESRFRTFDPAPPADPTGVVVGSVWLAAGASSLESADLRDRRVSNAGGEDSDTVDGQEATELGVSTERIQEEALIHNDGFAPGFGG